MRDLTEKFSVMRVIGTPPLPPSKHSSPEPLGSTLIYSAGEGEFREWNQQEGRVWDPRGVLPYMGYIYASCKGTSEKSMR